MTRVLSELLHPVLQAPMAGVATPALAAAVSNAGGLGAIALGALSPAAARARIRAVRELTARPVNYNVFAHAPARRNPALEQAWLRRLEPRFAAVAARPPEQLVCPYPSFVEDDGLLEVLLAERAEVVSFHFGLPRTDQLAALQRAGATTIGCATTLAETLAVAIAGLDMVVVQGAEAGGHRGCFDPVSDPCTPLMPLLAAALEAVRMPVIAAGGLMTGADLARVLAAGASGAQLGTAFIACPESAASAHHRALLARADADTAITHQISGRPARGLRNRWFESIAAEADASDVPDYPIAYAAGKALTAACQSAGSTDHDVCWAGTGAAGSRPMPAAALIATLARELAAARRQSRS